MRPSAACSSGPRARHGGPGRVPRRGQPAAGRGPGPELIGINNRDLNRFVTDLEQTFRLRDRIPPGVTLVSESGIRTRRDVERLEAAGVSAILVGEALMRADDIGLAVERLLGLEPETQETTASVPVAPAS